jgi:hypothetical protein
MSCLISLQGLFSNILPFITDLNLCQIAVVISLPEIISHKGIKILKLKLTQLKKSPKKGAYNFSDFVS